MRLSIRYRIVPSYDDRFCENKKLNCEKIYGKLPDNLFWVSIFTEIILMQIFFDEKSGRISKKIPYHRAFLIIAS